MTARVLAKLGSIVISLAADAYAYGDPPSIRLPCVDVYTIQLSNRRILVAAAGVQLLANAASPLRIAATWFYSASPSVCSLVQRDDRRASDMIDQSSVKQ
jgi:hypothetical protein